MKIGSQAHRTSAISSSNEDTILVRGRDLCSELIGKVSLHRPLLAARHGTDADRRAAPRARCDAGRDRRARPRAERAGEPHDARRGARSAAGRGRRRDPRLRLGDPRRVAEAAGASVADDRDARSGSGESTRQRSASRRRVSRGAGARSRATAIRCTRSSIRASRRLFEVAREAGRRGRYMRSARTQSKRVLPELDRQAARDECLRRRFPRCCSMPAIRSLALKGVPILARTAEPDRAPARGAAAGRSASCCRTPAPRRSSYDGAAPPDGFVPRDQLSARMNSRAAQASASSSRAPSSPGPAPA